MPYAWSPSRAAFFDLALQPLYEAHGTWPVDAAPATDAVYAAANPTISDGKRLGADAAGAPARVAMGTPAP